MPASHIAWSYAANTFLAIQDGWLRTNYAEPPLADVPRIMCGTLLFLRASHEAYADEQGIRERDLEPKDMVAFVYFAKNAIIHEGERISLVAGAPRAPPDGVRLAFDVGGFDIDFDGPSAKRALRDDNARGAAQAYATRRERRGVQGGLLAEIRDAIQDTADMIGVPTAMRARFDASGVPVVGLRTRA